MPRHPQQPGTPDSLGPLDLTVRADALDAFCSMCVLKLCTPHSTRLGSVHCSCLVSGSPAWLLSSCTLLLLRRCSRQRHHRNRASLCIMWIPRRRQIDQEPHGSKASLASAARLHTTSNEQRCICNTCSPCSDRGLGAIRQVAQPCKLICIVYPAISTDGNHQGPVHAHGLTTLQSSPHKSPLLLTAAKDSGQRRRKIDQADCTHHRYHPAVICFGSGARVSDPSWKGSLHFERQPSPPTKHPAGAINFGVLLVPRPWL
jgi:hypothetical protein